MKKKFTIGTAIISSAVILGVVSCSKPSNTNQSANTSEEVTTKEETKEKNDVDELSVALNQLTDALGDTGTALTDIYTQAAEEIKNVLNETNVSNIVDSAAEMSKNAIEALENVDADKIIKDAGKALDDATSKVVDSISNIDTDKIMKDAEKALDSVNNLLGGFSF